MLRALAIALLLAAAGCGHKPAAIAQATVAGACTIEPAETVAAAPGCGEPAPR